jgi:2-amino-4-hydroxy-6-hydroxymethyldihydropteridine diphosphokinase
VTLGSNVRPVKHVRWAVRELDRAIGVARVSTAYQAEPVGAPGTPTFLNAAVAIRTDLTPGDLKYRVLRPIEARLGRERTFDPNAPRTIDIDIAMIGDLEIADDHLAIRVPDPDIARYAHLAFPLRDLDPGLRHPAFDASLAEIAASLDAGGVVPRPDIDLDQEVVSRAPER